MKSTQDGQEIGSIKAVGPAVGLHQSALFQEIRQTFLEPELAL